MPCCFALVLVFSFGSLAFAQAGWRLDRSEAEWLWRSWHTVENFDGRLFVIQGADSWPASSLYNDVWSSSDGTGWQCETSAMFPMGGRNGVTSAVFKDRLWVMGGIGPGSFVHNDVWSSSDGATWVQEVVSAPWAHRSSQATVVFNGRMWILGGWTKQGSYDILANDVWSSDDGVNWTLEVAAAAWPPDAGHRAVVFNNRVWLFSTSVENDIWSTSDGVNWTHETVPPWAPRFGNQVRVYRGRVWYFGGTGYSADPYSQRLNDVWSSPDGRNWKLESPNAPWPARWGHASTVFNGRLWLLGGSGELTGRDVWSFGLHIHPHAPPDGTVGKSYGVPLEARVGRGPYVWTFVDGELPPGLSFEHSDSDTAQISGTPAEAGTYRFTLHLEDADGYTTQQEFAISIYERRAPNTGSGLLGCAAGAGWGGWVVAAGGPALALAAFLTIQALRPRRPRPRPKAR
jgi:hypothetical protein